MSNGNFTNPWDEGGVLASDWSSENAPALLTEAIQKGSGRESTTVYRKLPPIVQQYSSWSCWAAALESWLKAVNNGRQQYTQYDLVDKYATYKTGHPKAGGITPGELEDVFSEFGIQYYNMNIEGRTVRRSFIVDNLRKNGHGLIIYSSSDTAGHTLVLYGIGHPSGTELEISVMDPANGSYRNIPFSDFEKSFGQPIVICFAN